MIRSVSAVLITAASSVIVIDCGGGESGTPETVTVRDTVTASASPSVSASIPTAAPPSAEGPEQSWTMPDLRGRNLQDAQDAIQQLTNDEVFYTGSTDLTGQARNQMMDRSWQ